jgi:hypothetical protein
MTIVAGRPKWPDTVLMRLVSVAAVLVAIGCVGARAPAPERAEGPGGSAHFHVRVDESLTTLWTQICFGGEPPRAMVPLTSSALSLLVQAYDSEGEPIVTNDEGEIPLGRFAPGDCIHYEVDLQRASRGSRSALRRRGDLLITQSLWLWAPSQRPDTASYTVEFELPRGMHVSVPWAREGDGYLLEESCFRTAGNTVFTFHEPRRFERAGVQVEIARLPGELTASGSTLERWIGEAVDAVAGLYGTFPRDRLHIVVVPAGPGRRPVAFGLVRRGGGPSVMLLVHEGAAGDALVTDWTVVHELTHLSMPLLEAGDAWLSEGVATYYQEVLRARAGLQTETEAWANILDGFDRGARVGTRRTLENEARDMRETGAYRRVYWGGTAFVLEADVSLRARTGVSLDQLISRSQGAWPRRSTWQGRAIMHRFDRLAGDSVLVPLFDRYADSRDFPDLADVLDALGVERRGGRIVLDDDAPLAHVRASIMSPIAPLPESGQAAARRK